jgi:hypothetical protein
VRVRNPHAAQPDRVARREPVHVEAYPRAHIASHRQCPLRHLQIRRRRDLGVMLAAGDQGYSEPMPFSNGSVIREIVTCLRGRSAVCGENFGKVKPLRRLRAPEARPHNGFPDDTAGIGPLECIGDGNCSDGGLVRVQRREHAVDRAGVHEWPRRVVNENARRRPARQRFQPLEDGSLPGLASRAGRQQLVPRLPYGAGIALAVVRVDDNQDRVDPWMADVGIHCMCEERLAPKESVLLGASCSSRGRSALSAAGCDNQG